MKPLFVALIALAAVSFCCTVSAEGSPMDRMIKDLNSNDTMTIEIAAEELAALGKAAVPPLLDALNSGNRDRKAAAMEALAKLQAEQAVAPVLALLQQLGPAPREADTFSEGYLRHVAIRCLGRLGQPSVVPVLQEAAKSPNPYDQTAAVTGLALLKVPEALDRLLQLADSPSDDIRNLAVQGLAAVKDPRAVPKLEAKLTDPRWYVRDNAVEALAATGGAAAVQALKKAAQDANPFVQRTAKEALDQLEGR